MPATERCLCGGFDHSASVIIRRRCARLAEWLRGASDRVATAGMPRPRRSCSASGIFDRSLACYADYYNSVRTHLSLAKDAPRGRAVQAAGLIKALPILGGPHHRYSGSNLR